MRRNTERVRVRVRHRTGAIDRGVISACIDAASLQTAITIVGVSATDDVQAPPQRDPPRQGTGEGGGRLDRGSAHVFPIRRDCTDRRQD